MFKHVCEKVQQNTVTTEHVSHEIQQNTINDNFVPTSPVTCAYSL